MLVYVQDINGQPMMPTSRCGKVRRLLKSGKAKVVQRCPFTIRLLYDPETHIAQPIDLGIDAGSKTIGVSACTDKRELYAAEVSLRTDVVDKLSTRRELRRARRYRKTRYRKPRFLNRVRSKHKGWLAPSTEVKISNHLKTIADVMHILPVTHITVETASFDTQLLKATLDGNTPPQGTDYQRGEQLGFWNVREYVLCRDDHTCQCCKGRSKDKILNVHHIESRKTGGDSPDNLVTLCETCHREYHAGVIKLPASIKRRPNLRDAAFMSSMRWAFYERLKTLYPDMVSMTCGYLTKNTRIRHGLAKTHAIDARCISGHPDAEPLGYWYAQKKVRCHNRKLHETQPRRGSNGERRRTQSARVIKGFRLYDCVRLEKRVCFIFGKRTSGYFDLRLLDGTRINSGVSYKKLTLLEHSDTTLTERRLQGCAV